MTTYNELIHDVGLWLDRDDLSVQIPTFVKMGEQEVYRKLRISAMESISYTPLSTTSQYYDIPSNFISARNVYIDTSPPTKLAYVTPEQMILTVTSSNSNPRPIQYTIVDNYFKLDTVAASSDNNLYISYFRKFDELSFEGSTSTNWLLNNAYALFLYGAILGAEMYLYNDERIPMIRSEFDRIIFELNDQAEEGRYSGDSLRIRAT